MSELNKSGRTLNMLDETFWNHVDWSTKTKDECWPFIGNINIQGFGRYTAEGCTYMAHRVALVLAKKMAFVDFMPVLQDFNDAARVMHTCNKSYKPAIAYTREQQANYTPEQIQLQDDKATHDAQDLRARAGMRARCCNPYHMKRLYKQRKAPRVKSSMLSPGERYGRRLANRNQSDYVTIGIQNPDNPNDPRDLITKTVPRSEIKNL